MMWGENKNIVETVKRIPLNTVGVELGVWKGDSSEKFLHKAKHLYLVDSWSVEPYKGDGWDRYINRYKAQAGGNSIEDFQKHYDKIYNSVVKRFSTNTNVHIYRKTTDEFFKAFNEPVDWFYVDAAHDEEGVYKDLVNSYNHLKRNPTGGRIYGDDYGNKPGVVAGVDKFVKEYKLNPTIYAMNQYEILL